MQDQIIKSPVVLIIFNRPDAALKVFEQIRIAKPEKIFVIADGPRLNKPGELEKCNECRSIIESIDWKCEVFKYYSDTNLGCKNRVASGLNWVFDHVEEAIILEDDCLPNQSFFRFCDELLERYRYDERIMIISGTNVLEKWKDNSQSYHFTYSGGIWGWATWKRAWKYYDGDMKSWANSEIKSRIKDVIINPLWNRDLFNSFELSFLKKTDNWGYPWAFARFVQSGLSIVPSVNLISNIGFRIDATHTSENSKFANLPVYELNFPLRYNDFVMVDREFDNAWVNMFYKSFYERYFNKLKRQLIKIKKLFRNNSK